MCNTWCWSGLNETVRWVFVSLRNSAMGVRVTAGVAVGEVPVAGVGVQVWWRWRGGHVK